MNAEPNSPEAQAFLRAAEQKASIPVDFLWGNAELVIRNPHPSILKYLEYYHKSLDMDHRTWSRQVHRERTLLYREVEPGIITTFHGFLEPLISICNEHSLIYTVEDRRTHLPGPRLDRAQGFIHGQKALFFHLLGANKSGLCCAPTRYGKTVLIANMINVYPKVKTIVTAPGVSLLQQIESDLKRWCPGRDIRGIYTGSRNRKVSPDVTVVSMDSLEKAEPETAELLLVDEPHESVAPSRLAVMSRFVNARIIGFGATVTGRFDGADKLITGVIGPVLVNKTYRDAVEEGAICPIIVYFVRLGFMPWKVQKRDAAYRALVFRNTHFNGVVDQLLKQIPPDWQTLTFIDEIKQGDLIAEVIANSSMAIASRMSKEERDAKAQAMVSGEIKRCFATSIYATGMTFPHVRVMVNAAGGGGSITATQRPGRLAQKMPGKKAGYVIDFLFEPNGQVPGEDRGEQAWRFVMNDCYNRIGHYRKVGFDVRLVEKIEDIRFE